MTLMSRPSAPSFFFNWFAPIRLEPMPASQANTTRRTSAARFTTIWFPIPPRPPVLYQGPVGVMSREGRLGRRWCPSWRGAGRDLLVGVLLLLRHEAQEHGADDERHGSCRKDSEEDAKVLTGRRHREIREDAARRWCRRKTRARGDEDGVGRDTAGPHRD